MSMRDLNACVYEAEVDHRLEHVRRYLRDFLQGQPSSVMVPLWNLRALQDESRQAGHKDLSELCVWMERRIMALQTRRDENAGRLVAEIARVGEYVKQRAHTAAHGCGTSRPENVEPLMEANIA
jgi:phosphoenolpyruvate synthase/pyruvate phosphate dikinase